jgi:hypothetical protein
VLAQHGKNYANLFRQFSLSNPSSRFLSYEWLNGAQLGKTTLWGRQTQGSTLHLALPMSARARPIPLVGWR